MDHLGRRMVLRQKEHAVLWRRSFAFLHVFCSSLQLVVEDVPLAEEQIVGAIVTFELVFGASVALGQRQERSQPVF